MYSAPSEKGVTNILKLVAEAVIMFRDECVCVRVRVGLRDAEICVERELSDRRQGMGRQWLSYWEIFW